MFAARIANRMLRLDLNKNNPMTNTVIVKPEARDNVYHGSLLPVNFIAGKEYMPPISIPITIKPSAYAGILFSKEVGLDMLLLETVEISGAPKRRVRPRRGELN